MLGKGGVEGSRDCNVIGSGLLPLLIIIVNGLRMMKMLVKVQGGDGVGTTGSRCRDRSHGGRGLHLGLDSRGQPRGEAIPPCHEELGVPTFALGDRVGPIGKRGFLVVLCFLLLLLLLLHFQLLQLLLPGEQLGVPALVVGEGLALGDLLPQDRLELRSALLDAKELMLDEADATPLGKVGEACGSGRLSCSSRKGRRGRIGEIDGTGTGTGSRSSGRRNMDLGLGLSLSLGLSLDLSLDLSLSLGVLLPQLDGAGHVELLGVEVLLHELLEAVGLLHPHEAVGVDAAVELGTSVADLLLADQLVAQVGLVAAEVDVEEGVLVGPAGDLAEAPAVQFAGEGGELARAKVPGKNLAGELGGVVNQEAPSVRQPRDGVGDGLIGQHLHETVGEARDLGPLRGRGRSWSHRGWSRDGGLEDGGNRPLAEREGPAERLALTLLGRETGSDCGFGTGRCGGGGSGSGH